MYAKIKDNIVVKYPYTIEDLYSDNPYSLYNQNVNMLDIFPTTEQHILHQYSLVEVFSISPPPFDEKMEKINEINPIFQDGEWRQQFAIVEMSEFEKNEKSQLKATEVRRKRNQMLADSDWTQISDSPVDKQPWAAYRQLLRDITDQEGFPYNINWPVTP
jgi:hypothetical protein